jgi:hypothetical protein
MADDEPLLEIAINGIGFTLAEPYPLPEWLGEYLIAANSMRNIASFKAIPSEPFERIVSMISFDKTFTISGDLYTNCLCVITSDDCGSVVLIHIDQSNLVNAEPDKVDTADRSEINERTRKTLERMNIGCTDIEYECYFDDVDKLVAENLEYLEQSIVKVGDSNYTLINIISVIIRHLNGIADEDVKKTSLIILVESLGDLKEDGHYNCLNGNLNRLLLCITEPETAFDDVLREISYKIASAILGDDSMKILQTCKHADHIFDTPKCEHCYSVVKAQIIDALREYDLSIEDLSDPQKTKIKEIVKETIDSNL